MNRRTRLIGLVALLLVATLLPAQRRRRDPLSEAEVDQLRELAQEPEKRIKLFVKFVRFRMVAVEQARVDPQLGSARGKAVHDALEDLSSLVDELDQNIETYDRQKSDLRKALKDVVEMDTDLQAKLKALKDAAAVDAKGASEARDYKFILEDATESVNASLDSARETLQAEVEYFKAKDKEKEKKK